MGVPLERALYVGDNLIDAECAVRARVRFYGLLPDPSDALAAETTAERFTAAGAAAVARDLPELGRHLGVAPKPRPA